MIGWYFFTSSVCYQSTTVHVAEHGSVTCSRFSASVLPPSATFETQVKAIGLSVEVHFLRMSKKILALKTKIVLFIHSRFVKSRAVYSI